MVLEAAVRRDGNPYPIGLAALDDLGEEHAGKVWKQRIRENVVNVPSAALHLGAARRHSVHQLGSVLERESMARLHPPLDLAQLQPYDLLEVLVPHREIGDDDESPQEGGLEDRVQLRLERLHQSF